MLGHLETNVVSDDVEQETTDKIAACGVEDTGARKVEAETIMVVEFETIVHVVLEPPVEIPTASCHCGADNKDEDVGVEWLREEEGEMCLPR